MLVGIGIKNAILMVLIVLIMHFVLKNASLEKGMAASVRGGNGKDNGAAVPSQVVVLARGGDDAPDADDGEEEGEEEALKRFVFSGAARGGGAAGGACAVVPRRPRPVAADVVCNIAAKGFSSLEQHGEDHGAPAEVPDGIGCYDAYDTPFEKIT